MGNNDVSSLGVINDWMWWYIAMDIHIVVQQWVMMIIFINLGLNNMTKFDFEWWIIVIKVVMVICTKIIKDTNITEIIIVNLDNICDDNIFIIDKIVWLAINYGTLVSWGMNSIIIIDTDLMFIVVFEYGTSVNLCLIILFGTKRIRGGIGVHNLECH